MLQRDLPVAALNSFNAVRLFAALQVVYFHTWAHFKFEPTPILFDVLSQLPGVPIFFALSGCLVLDSCLRAKSVGSYARNRAVRIYPGLLVNIAVLETLMLLTNGMHPSSVEPARFLAYEVIYGVTASDFTALHWSGAWAVRGVSSFFAEYPSGVLWTLTVELTFYLIIPLALVVGARRSLLTALILVFSAASAFYIAVIGVRSEPINQAMISVTVIPYFWMFATGMLFRLWLPPVSAYRFAVPALAAAILCLSFVRGQTWPDWRDLPSAAIMLQMITVGLLALFVGISPLLKSRWLDQNDMSYGTYLWHMLIVLTMLGLGASSYWWSWLVATGLSVGMGYLSWHLVEKPAKAFFKRSVRSADRSHLPTPYPGRHSASYDEPR